MSSFASLSGKERARWPPLTRMLMAGEFSGTENPRPLTWKERLDRWMVNEGWRRLFVGIFFFSHILIFVFGCLHYGLKDNLTESRRRFGATFIIARSAALVLHVDVAIILFPVCRNFISLLRQTPLNGIVPLDKATTFHKLTAWSIFLFSWIHTIAHWNNLGRFSAANNLGFMGFILANLVTGPGWSGYVMLIALSWMVYTAMEKRRRANFERFWYSHHLFIIFFVFWAIHGSFCMIPQDFAPFCSGTGVFWQYWMYGGFLYLAERISREIRGRHRTQISKVILHPSNVCEIQIKKEHTKAKAGQYMFICIPEVSVWQYHPFTLTSAPEEDYISCHMRMVGDFTRAAGKVLGCTDGKGEKENGGESETALRRILPRVYVDGPFGSASEDVFKYETVVLCGAGIGVTPFASILKSVWYRMSYPQGKTRLRKVYFFWVVRDFGSLEWFRSLLLAIEAQDLENRIEIHTYLTAKIRPDEASNIMINDANAEADALTGLRSPTNFGRPAWGQIFRSIKKIHSPGEAGVFFCGPAVLSSALHIQSNMWTDSNFAFHFNKENF